jgi:hypothetical protein
MVNSSIRKQALVGWFCNNTRIFSNMQLQKFLFFYECFSKIDGDVYELEGLKGYKNGPVFSAVLGDMRSDDNFKDYCQDKFLSSSDTVNERRAKLSNFFMNILGNKLSEFTHEFNIWAVKKKEIENGEQFVSLNEHDLSEHDITIFQTIKSVYPESYIDSVDVIHINGKAFVFYKTDSNRLNNIAIEALNEISYDPEFTNPVYLTFTETGELLLD